MMPHTPQIEPEVRAEIDHRLAALASEEGVRLLLAVESGSRAWGFPSPDSDYDVRFIYLRPRRDYLALKTLRDVIERPIVDEIDLNGWDVRKAFGLMLRHNAVVSEWLQSPVRYVEDHPFISQMSKLADRHFNPRGFARHYANLGKGSVARWFGEDGGISVKRYFYALRPALSIRALRLAPDRRPPMQLQELVSVCDLDAGLEAEIANLVAMKAQTNEAGNTARMSAIETIVADELERAEEVPERRLDSKFLEEADALFLQLVDEQ